MGDNDEHTLLVKIKEKEKEKMLGRRDERELGTPAKRIRIDDRDEDDGDEKQGMDIAILSEASMQKAKAETGKDYMGNKDNTVGKGGSAFRRHSPSNNPDLLPLLQEAFKRERLPEPNQPPASPLANLVGLASLADQATKEIDSNMEEDESHEPSRRRNSPISSPNSSPDESGHKNRKSRGKSGKNDDDKKKSPNNRSSDKEREKDKSDKEKGEKDNTLEEKKEEVRESDKDAEKPAESDAGETKKRENGTGERR
eukprot:TRINITY_DN6977_c0_g1_i1.p1 TRINITY_DN6977_c0_g1~~TRINITY_DN6977_c0_g1_i1.p1  ORF type:complete len:255 (-),score=90.44 TRINITY_DN6977_c0_g1_i1:308-1072(-)